MRGAFPPLRPKQMRRKDGAPEHCGILGSENRSPGRSRMAHDHATAIAQQALESEAGRELNFAVAIHLRALNLPEVRAADVGIRVGKFGCVEKVEGIAMQLEHVA